MSQVPKKVWMPGGTWMAKGVTNFFVLVLWQVSSMMTLIIRTKQSSLHPDLFLPFMAKTLLVIIVLGSDLWHLDVWFGTDSTKRNSLFWFCYIQNNEIAKGIPSSQCVTLQTKLFSIRQNEFCTRINSFVFHILLFSNFFSFSSHMVFYCYRPKWVRNEWEHIRKTLPFDL